MWDHDRSTSYRKEDCRLLCVGEGLAVYHIFNFKAPDL